MCNLVLCGGHLRPRCRRSTEGLQSTGPSHFIHSIPVRRSAYKKTRWCQAQKKKGKKRMTAASCITESSPSSRRGGWARRLCGVVWGAFYVFVPDACAQRNARKVPLHLVLHVLHSSLSVAKYSERNRDGEQADTPGPWLL